MFLSDGGISVIYPLLASAKLLTEVRHPGCSRCQGNEDLLVGEVEWHRQLTQHRNPAVGLGDQLSAGLR